MGGYGSGQWQTGKSLTAGHRALDVRRLQRDGLLVPGNAFAWNWTRDGETRASILIRAEADRVNLAYRHRAEGGDWHPMDYPVRLDWPAGVLNGTGWKPPGMHWRTFERLTAQHGTFLNAALAGMSARLRLPPARN